jgi:preprotein translocase subunit SecA
MDADARRAAYACDVTYCTNKELTFDYLKDRITLKGQPNRMELQLERLFGADARARRLLLRGLHYAIVDEADSVLVDEARTPLIISAGGSDPGARREYERALAFAERLVPAVDFVVDTKERTARITDAGATPLAELAKPLGGLWTGRHRREEMVRQALTALHLFHRDLHYLVADSKVQIIDEYTGRLMPDRSWERGLHQLIEVKEGCDVTDRRDPVARISYQRFFRRYLRLAGMTGTAREVEGELWAVYELGVVRVPTHRPLRRKTRDDRVFATADARWNAVVARVSAFHARGRPILLGTRSVAASEHLSDLLRKADLDHRVLNARQDGEEAAVIAEAGMPGQITVATNMAGRGTDIRLGAGVAERGGLHVIATERHEAGRIDRQLFGRCGRQGDPGSYEAMVSLDDELLTVYGRGWARLARLMSRRAKVPGWIGGLALRRAQRAAERTHARIRKDLLKTDQRLERTLAFSGRQE